MLFGGGIGMKIEEDDRHIIFTCEGSHEWFNIMHALVKARLSFNVEFLPKNPDLVVVYLQKFQARIMLLWINSEERYLVVNSDAHYFENLPPGDGRVVKL